MNKNPDSIIAAVWRQLRPRTTEERLRQAEVDRLTEQVLEMADPRLRAVGGYRRRLNPAVEKVLEYYESLVRRMPGPIQADTRSWGSDPLVNAFFGSAERLREVLSSRQIHTFFQERRALEGDTCYALLSARPVVRKTLGMEMVGDMLRRDVLQTTFSFADHRVDMPSASEKELRSSLLRFAIEQLVGIAATHLAERESRIAELETRQRLLSIRQRVASAGDHGLGLMAPESAEPLQEPATLGEQLDEVEKQLALARQGMETLDDRLDRLAELLGRPEEHLSLETFKVRLNRMNVVQESAQADDGYELEFTRGRRSDREGRVGMIVRFPRSELLPEKDFLREAARYLGG